MTGQSLVQGENIGNQSVPLPGWSIDASLPSNILCNVVIPIISGVLGFIKPANPRKPGYVELALQFNITHSEAEYKYQKSQSMRPSQDF